MPVTVFWYVMPHNLVDTY